VAPWEMKPEWPASDLPKTRWSDAVAVDWNTHAPAGSDLKRIYRSKVAFDQSQRLMESALLKIGKSGELEDLPLWPGVDFTPGDHPDATPMEPATEAFMGLLACSHAAGPAYLLFQHRAMFGKKRINKIKIWKTPSLPTQNMLLYIDSA
jgi:hypothetical protein